MANPTFVRMQRELLAYLACPLSGSPLDFFPLSPEDSGEIREGILLSACGPAYPVIAGVPRLLPDAILEHDDFLRKNLPEFEERKQLTLSQFSYEIHLAERKNRRTRASFTQEWKGHDYGSGHTWNQDAATQEQQFYAECGETSTQIHGKIVLDAGCGNGQLAMRLASSAAVVLAMDFSAAVEMAASVNLNRNCHFIQADVEFPPLKKGIADLIYCSGVLIHTRNTRNSFFRLLPCLAQNGKFSIWVYRRRSELLHRLFNQLREHTARLPQEIQHTFLRYFIFYPALLMKRIKKNFQPASGLWVEVLDWFTPEFRHEHEEEEVLRWYTEAGLSKARISDTNHWGFSVLGENRPANQELPGILV